MGNYKVHMELIYTLVDAYNGKVVRDIVLSTNESTDTHGIPKIKSVLIDDCKTLEGIIQGLV